MGKYFKHGCGSPTKGLFILATILILALGTTSMALAGPVVADFVLLNGKVVTVDSNDSIVQAVAVKSGKIIALGTSSEIRSLVGAETRVIDVRGRTVIPGLLDSHGHHARTAMRAGRSVDVSQEAGVDNIADLQEKIRARAATIPKGARISCSKEDDFKLAEKRHPTRWELDEAAPDNPVSVSTVGGHFTIYNSLAFELAGITKDTPDPEGGKFERDPVTGELTGGTHETARRMVSNSLPSVPDLPMEIQMAALKAAMLDWSRNGLTTIYNSGSGALSAMTSLRRQGEQIVRFRTNGSIDALSALGADARGIGDEWIKVVGSKHLMDGACSARTLYMREPFLHRDDDFYGVLTKTKVQIFEELDRAWAAGIRTSTHSNGDAALDIYLDVIEELQKRYPEQTDRRDIIIHCTVTPPDIVARIASLGLFPTIFGAYPWYHGDKLAPAYGEKRLEYMFAVRSFIDAGVGVSAHSDYSASPYPPLMAFQGLVNRVTSGGKPTGQSQKISVMECLRLYTINAAYMYHDEDILGSLEIGKYGDMVVLGEDILTVPTMTLIDVPIDITIVGGEIVFKR